jgi:uncharacterized protein YndB with AHSA1/START domain
VQAAFSNKIPGETDLVRVEKATGTSRFVSASHRNGNDRWQLPPNGFDTPRFFGRNKPGLARLRQMQSVHLTPIYRASAERLFDAWTKPELMRLWLFKSANGRLSRVEQNLVIGGRFSVVENRGGQEIEHFGEYLEIEPPYRLAFSLEAPARFPGRSNVVVSFLPSAEGCEMDFLQVGVDPAVVEASWRAMFQNLAGTMLRT